MKYQDLAYVVLGIRMEGATVIDGRCSCKSGEPHYHPDSKKLKELELQIDVLKNEKEAVNQTLKHDGLEPWPDGRSVYDGKRPWEQHIGMVINSLKCKADIFQQGEASHKAEVNRLNRLIDELKDKASVAAVILKQYVEGSGIPLERSVIARQLIETFEGLTERPECDCMIPALEGAGQHSPKCAIFKQSEKRKVTPQNCGCGISSCMLEFHRADCPLRKE